MPSLESQIGSALDINIVASSSLGGGCIARVEKFEGSNGKSYVLKSGLSKEAVFAEANGLKELTKANAIKIPKVILTGPDFLLMEYIKPGQKAKHFYVKLGEGLANLHRYEASHFGLATNNFIGSTVQLNQANGIDASNWSSFYTHNRIEFQYQLALKNGLVDTALSRAYDKLRPLLKEILATDDAKPSLLHGDLWGGNYIVDNTGEPCLIDPAVYYGHREADLAMTKIFGGFTHEFYQAYHQSYPLAEGWEYRENVYKLYHILNHLNLFGAMYYAEALALMNYYVQ